MHSWVQGMFGTVCPRGLLTLPVETSLWVLEAGVSKRGVVLWAPVLFFLGRPCVHVGRGAVCTSGCSVLCLSCRGCSGSTQSTCASSGADFLWHCLQPAQRQLEECREQDVRCHLFQSDAACVASVSSVETFHRCLPRRQPAFLL